MQILSGLRFNYLTVTRFDHRKQVQGGTRLYWECQCDCGNTVVVEAAKLRSGHTQSCGCYQKKRAAEARTKHGHCGRKNPKSPIYESWRAMRERCSNPKSIGWKHYGGRGITVCKQWQDDFGAFLKDMGPTWKPDLTIDRIDVDGNYEPGNCRWATMAEQVRNTRKAKASALLLESCNHAGAVPSGLH